VETWDGGVAVAGAPTPSNTTPRFADALAAGGASLDAAAAAMFVSDPTSWTDFWKAPLPRTAASARARPLSTLPPTAGWGPPPSPEDAASVEDGIRRHAEGCDAFGGFLVLAADAGGWGATASAVLAAAADDYPRAPRIVFCVRDNEGDDATSVAAAAAEALSGGMLAPAADLCCPLAPSGSRFVSAALAGVAIDGATTCMRLARGPGAGSAAGLAALLAPPRGVAPRAALAAAFPALSANPVQEAVSYTPGVASNSCLWSGPGLGAEAVSARGLGAPHAPLPAAAAAALLEACLPATRGSATRHVAAASAPLALPLPFPAAAARVGGAATAPLLTRLATGSGLADDVARTARLLAKPPPAWRAALTEWGVDDEAVGAAAEAAAAAAAAFADWGG